MGREVEHPPVPVKSILCAVPVMHVEIDYREALQASVLQQVRGGNRHVVEETEPHGAGRRRVMPGRPHQTERGI